MGMDTKLNGGVLGGNRVYSINVVRNLPLPVDSGFVRCCTTRAGLKAVNGPLAATRIARMFDAYRHVYILAVGE